MSYDGGVWVCLCVCLVHTWGDTTSKNCNIFRDATSNVNYDKVSVLAMPLQWIFPNNFDSSEFHSLAESIKWLVTICNGTKAHNINDSCSLLTFEIRWSITLSSIWNYKNFKKQQIIEYVTSTERNANVFRVETSYMQLLTRDSGSIYKMPRPALRSHQN